MYGLRVKNILVAITGYNKNILLITPPLCFNMENSRYFFFREGGDIGRFITLVPKVLIRFSYSLAEKLLGLLLYLIGWIIKLVVQTFQPPILIFRSLIRLSDILKNHAWHRITDQFQRILK